MEEKILLAELTKNCGEKKEKVCELLSVYELTELGRDVWRQQFKDIEDRVLQENEFFCERDVNSRYEDMPKSGERILIEKWDFLLSDEDFERLQALLHPIYVKENLTDEKGYYIENWDMKLCDARCELVDYIINEIIPASLRQIFWENRLNIIYQEKLIKITKDAFFKEAA